MTTAKIDAKELSQAIAFVSKVIESRNSIPVLGLIHLTARRGFVTIKGTDLDIENQTSVAAITEGTLEVMLPPKLVSFILNGETGVVEISQSADRTTVSVGGSVMEIGDNIHVVDYPKWFTADDIVASIEIPEAELLRILTLCRASISNEETRYYLNGVYIHSVDGKLAIVSTDGYRLTLVKTEITWVYDGFILPKKTVDILMQTIRKGGNGTVKMRLLKGGMKTVFNTPTSIIRSKNIDGSFPNYNRVIPKPSDNIKVTIPSAVARKLAKGPVKIDPENGVITQDLYDVGVKITTNIEKGVGEFFGMNSGLIKPLCAIVGDVTFSGENSGSPFMCKAEDESALFVIMPMRV